MVRRQRGCHREGTPPLTAFLDREPSPADGLQCTDRGAPCDRAPVTALIVGGPRETGYEPWKCRQGPGGCWGPVGEWLSGGVLLSHPVSGAVPSALRGLASGFGMGPGVPSRHDRRNTVNAYHPRWGLVRSEPHSGRV